MRSKLVLAKRVVKREPLLSQGLEIQAPTSESDSWNYN